MKEAIILAGGLGTRLKGVISDIPKPMAPVCGKPFLEYLLSSLLKWKISKIILSVGYKNEVIKKYFGDNFKGIKIVYVVEKEPLGTGGAISLALKKVQGNNVFILNGDTYFDVDLNAFAQFCIKEKSGFGIALKQMKNFDRYGTVNLHGNRIIQFNEKQAVAEGFINCGIYYLNKKSFNQFNFPEKYSFETEFLEKNIAECNFIGYPGSGYFIDIGIPEDFLKAQQEFPNHFKKLI